MRIWLLEQVEKLEAFLKDLIRVMIARAQSEIKHIMPGYTHLQVYMNAAAAQRRD